MKIHSPKLLVLAAGISLCAQLSTICVCAQDNIQAPPPTDNSQIPPPPPPQPVYQDAPPPQQGYVAPAPVGYQSFYDELSPYGQWVNSPVYGYVWVPYAGPDFQPYGTAGHWVLTVYGWTWVSDYPWGWAPFHYGRWDFDSFYGWYWIPGNEWSPAWVSWRSSPGYYGWCPLGPTYVYGGYATYNSPPERYVFVRTTYINSPYVENYYAPRGQYATYYSNSTVVNNTYYDNSSHATYYAGPPREEVERYTGAPVRPVTMVDASSPEKSGSSDNEIRVFRPAVQQPVATASVKPAPAKVYEKNDVAPMAQRPVLTHANQPRVAPFKPENTQHSANEPAEQNKSLQPQVQVHSQPQVQQSKPPVQTQQQPVQQQHHNAQQQPQVQQQRPPVQTQQRPPAQQQRQQPPANQQRPAQQQHPKQQKNKPQPKKQQPAQAQPDREKKQ
jgi:hypothetical protein